MEIHLLIFLTMLCVGIPRTFSEVLSRQKRNWIIDSFIIEEDYKGTFPYVLDRVKIDKELTMFRIKGMGVDEEPRDVLRIDENTGVITVYKPVDHEQYQVLRLTFQAVDREKEVVETQLGIHVRILDANDNAPVFTHKIYEIFVNESKLQGSILITVKATDRDTTPAFSVFDITMVSVEPKVEDVEFFLTHIPNTDVATISFKGCLDYETVSKYTFILEAKDHGKPPLSSTCTVIMNIVDGNNHLPVITQQKGLTKVKEHEKDILIFRVPVTDQDTVGTSAWKAKYNIIGDKNKHFKMSTDPKTNDGLLYVEKSLNYEDDDMVNITITAENEIPFYHCKVLERSKTELWKIFYEGETSSSSSGPELTSQRVSVMVEDVNESPLLKDNKASITENAGDGKQLVIFQAQDPDVKSANKIKYVIGEDPAGWIKVDAKSGKVTTTSKNIDREASFVTNDTYITTILAIDDGIPPMTGTATLTIHINDENDNTPFLERSMVDMCHSDPISKTKISASDLDIDPNAGPFHFVLLEEEGSWRVEPSTGYSVDLIKENDVHSGVYELSVEVSDLQGNSDIQRLTVTVCNCMDSENPNCSFRKSAGSALGAGAILIMFLGLLLLAGLLLLVLFLTCKKEKIPISDDSSGHLMISNTETPGSDCTVSFGSNVKAVPQVQTEAVNSSFMSGAADYGLSQTDAALQQEAQNIQWATTDEVREDLQLQRQRSFVRNSMRSSMGRRPARRTLSSGSWMSQREQLQTNHLYKMLNGLQAPGNELLDYVPKTYADEGTLQPTFDLDALTLSEVSFNPDTEWDLKFHKLASVCMPRETSGFNTVTGQP